MPTRRASKWPCDRARVYDYVDAHVPMLARMYEKRLKGYRAIGYELESEPGNDADVQRFIGGPQC